MLTGGLDVSSLYPSRQRSTEGSRVVHMRFDAREMARLRHYAAGCGVSVSTLIRALIRDSIDRADRKGYLRLEIPDLEVMA